VTSWVVVGAGAAGCVVAARLAANRNDHVTLVEAGSATPPSAIHGDNFLAAVAAPGWTFPEPFTRGRGLGGSGAVNGMVADVGDPAQYAAWGWDDAPSALDRVRMPVTPAADHELGPIDRALLVAAPDARRLPLTRRDGRRVTPADAYLTDLPADRLDMRTDAAAMRIELRSRSAVGVRLAGGDVVEGDRIVLAAGALGSPALLLRSGIDAPGIGEGLRNHPGLPIVLRLRAGVEAAVDGLVISTGLRRDDIEILALNHLGAEAPGLASLLVVLLTPTGRGHLTLDPVGAEDGGGITAHQVVSAADHAALGTGVATVHGLLEHPAFGQLVDDVEVGAAPAGVFHPTSTCAMGTVVDDDGAVFGYERLHVVDASLFPDIPATFTYLPTLMLAERMAARLTASAARSA